MTAKDERALDRRPEEDQSDSSLSAVDQALMEELESVIPRLRRYARSLTRDQHRGDDLVQDTLVRALDKLHLYQRGTNLLAWLFTIMRNLHINSLRSAKWERSQAETQVELPVPGLQISNLAMRDLAQAMSKLPDDQRETVVLVAVEGMAYQDVAQIMQVPIGTVRSRLSRARDRLRHLVQGENSEGGPADGE